MNTIIAFPTRNRTRSAFRKRPAGTTADIIIFPGVRYEHYDTPEDGGRPKPRSRGKSDHANRIVKRG